MRNEHFGRTDNQILPRVVAIFDFDQIAEEVWGEQNVKS